VKNRVVLLVPILFFSCGVLKTNKYLMHYKELNEVSGLENVMDLGDKYHPRIIEFQNSNTCVEEYQRLRAEGYTLIGYSLFQHEQKLSNGLAVQAGKKLGAHKVLLSREKSNEGSSDHRFPLPDEMFKEKPIIQAIMENEGSEKKTAISSYAHLALFLVQLSLDNR